MNQVYAIHRTRHEMCGIGSRLPLTDLLWYDISPEGNGGRSGGLGGANRHRFEAESVGIEASTVSIGGGGSTVDVVAVGETSRMVNGCGRIHSVERLLL